MLEIQGRGLVIAVEGLDGSGKSKQVGLLAERVRQLGLRAYETFEPTDSPIGSVIHQMMTGRISSDDRTIAALFAADRLDHIQNALNGLRSKVEDGVVVVCDRYYFSSYAYHSVSLPLEWVIALNAEAARLLRPDVTVFVDVPPEECLRRLHGERWHLELYENLEHLTAVRERYLAAFEALAVGEKIVTVDGTLSPSAVSEAIWQAAGPLIEKVH